QLPAPWWLDGLGRTAARQGRIRGSPAPYPFVQRLVLIGQQELRYIEADAARTDDGDTLPDVRAVDRLVIGDDGGMVDAGDGGYAPLHAGGQGDLIEFAKPIHPGAHAQV